MVYQLEGNSVFRSYSRRKWIVFSGVIPEENESKYGGVPYSFWKRLNLPLSSRIPLCSAVRRAFPMYTMCFGGSPELSLPTIFIRWTEFSGVLPELLLATTSIWCTDFPAFCQSCLFQQLSFLVFHPDLDVWQFSFPDEDHTYYLKMNGIRGIGFFFRRFDSILNLKIFQCVQT